MNSQPGKKLKERCDKFYNQETFLACGVKCKQYSLSGGNKGEDRPHYTVDNWMNPKQYW